MSRRAIRLALGCLVVVATPGFGDAQSLESRVRAVEGDVSFAFAIREGVEVCEDGISWDREHNMRWGRWGEDRPRSCSEGLAVAVLRVRQSDARGVELVPFQGPGTGADGPTFLGRVGTEEAARFLLSLARSGGNEDRAAKEAMVGAVVADSVEVWPDLLELARDRTVSGDVRESAVFWVGQAAATAATEGLARLARDESEGQDIRDAAVFALSQRPDEEAVPILMELARTAEQAETRRTAMFWLAQSKDTRVLGFFEEILLGRSGGG